MPIIDCEQGSADWLTMRTACVTGSRVCHVMTKLKRKEGEAACRQDYKAEIVCEILTGRSAEHYVSPAMQWGIETEPLARAEYEIQCNTIVESVGLAFHPTIKRFASSPDGLLGTDGLVEYKCPNTATHLEYIITGEIPLQYQQQMLAEMACAERQFADFVSYDPRLPKRLQLFIRRFERDDDRIREMEREVVQFLKEVDELIERIKAAEPINLTPYTIERALLGSLQAAKESNAKTHQR